MDPRGWWDAIKMRHGSGELTSLAGDMSIVCTKLNNGKFK
jgi:hypothetical protein